MQRRNIKLKAFGIATLLTLIGFSQTFFHITFQTGLLKYWFPIVVIMGDLGNLFSICLAAAQFYFLALIFLVGTLKFRTSIAILFVFVVYGWMVFEAL